MKTQNTLNAPTLILLALIALTCGTSLSEAKGVIDPAPRPVTSPDIDRQLLENLDAEQANDLDRQLFGPNKKPPAAQPGKTPTKQPATTTERPGDQIVRDLLKELRQTDAAQHDAAKKQPAPEIDTRPAAAQDNPLINIARQMRSVEQRIEKTDSGPNTQKTQQQIVDQLQRLIEQAKKSCGGGKPGQKQCQGGTCQRKKVTQSKPPSKNKSKGTGSTPGQSSSSAAVKEPAPPRRTDMQEMQALLKRLWGELPERDREQMLQYPVEQFLPEYEQMIEEYYKRLSEDKED